MAVSGTDSSNDSWIRDCFSHVSVHGKTCLNKNMQHFSMPKMAEGHDIEV